MKRLMLAALVALGLSGPAAADYWSEFEAGVDAFAAGRHDAALGHFRPLAEHGDNRSQYWLGIMYFEGKGVPEDFVRAHMWLSLAARGGNRGARIGRDGIADRMSAAEIAEAERLAASWQPSQ